MIKKTLYIILFLFAVHKVLLWTAPTGPLLIKWSFSKEILDRDGRLLRLSTARDQIYRLHTKLDNISPLAQNATLLYEDRYFYYHFGINPFSLLRAFYETYIKRKRVLGASTVTMQFARAYYKINSKTVWGKLEQMARALQIEFMYSKKEILEAYLNIVPYGFNIEGLGAASKIYFNKSPGRLTLLESLTLAVIPQRPQKRTKGIKELKRIGGTLKAARKTLLDQWKLTYPDNVERDLNFNLDLDLRHPRDLPFNAKHLVMEMMETEISGKISLTVDLSIQLAFEEMAKSYIKRHKKVGLNNMAALLIDSNTMEVLASLGSVDFFNDKISGQVNGVKARRSPGSALKPFAYGLALDQGIIHPLTMLKDAPTPFGTYTPDNFDRAFAGPLSATEALIHSRNIPAILLAQKLRNPSLYDFLQTNGIPLNPDPEHYGLSIVLGTAETTMEELVELYAILNNDGKRKSIRKLLSSLLDDGKSTLSQESSFLIREMLSQNPRPDGGSKDKWRLRPQSVAWKTGTSVGFRDAWAIGIFDHYVLAVWLGNFSGTGNSAFVGRHAAGPLLFSLIETLGKMKEIQFTKKYPTFDLNIRDVEVCALSGSLPHKDCPHRKRGQFIPGVAPIKKCRVHRRIEIDRMTGLQVCSKFQGNTESRVFEYWPTDLLKLFKQAGVGRKMPPRLHPICKSVSFGEIGPPNFVS